MKEDNYNSKITIVDIITSVFFLMIFFIGFSNSAIKKHQLKTKGELVKGVIINSGIDRGQYKLDATYVYAFCINNQKYQGSFRPEFIYGKFLYGDEVTIVYNPKNPKNNKAIFDLYKKNPEIVEKYKHEFPKVFGQDQTKLYHWKSWEYILDFQSMYPVHSKYPCLPPWY